MCGLAIRRSSPPIPLSTSSGSPIASDRLLSSAATVTDGDMAVPSGFGLNQPEIAVGTTEQHGHRVGRRIAEHDHRIVAVADLGGGVLDAHRLDGVAPHPDDAGAARRRLALDGWCAAARTPLGAEAAAAALRT